MSQYQAVASNTSGSTPKDLFEDVIEELEKQVSILYLVMLFLTFPQFGSPRFILLLFSLKMIFFFKIKNYVSYLNLKKLLIAYVTSSVLFVDSIMKTKLG